MLNVMAWFDGAVVGAVVMARHEASLAHRRAASQPDMAAALFGAFDVSRLDA